MKKKSSNETLSKEEMKSVLFNDLEKAILELNVALENYNIATPELVDYYSYQIKAAQSKYEYLLKLVKDMKLSKFKKII